MIEHNHSRANSCSVTRRTRRMTPPDAVTVASWICSDLPVPKALAADLPKLLKRLIEEERLNGVCVETIPSRSQAWHLEAFGFSGFIADEYADAYSRDPFPWLPLVLLEQTRTVPSAPGLLDYDAIAAANAADGLNLVPLLWLQRPLEPGEGPARELAMLAQQTLIQSHRGYRLKRILKEVPAALEYLFLAGGFKRLVPIPAGTPSPLPGLIGPDDRMLVGLSQTDVAHATPGAAIAWLFTASPPACRFTRKEQDVLLGAVDGLTDEEIAAQLHVTPNAVKERWRSIYERVESAAGHVFAQTENAANTNSRGPEKRRRVLAYIDDHPEEIRPYAG